VIVDEDTDDIIARLPTPASAASILGEDEHPPWPYLAYIRPYCGHQRFIRQNEVSPVSAEEYGITGISKFSIESEKTHCGKVIR